VNDAAVGGTVEVFCSYQCWSCAGT